MSAGRLDADKAQQRIPDAVEQPNDRLKQHDRQPERSCDPEGDAFRFLKGERFWYEFAKNHVEEGDQLKGDGDGCPMHCCGTSAESQPAERRFDERNKRRMADPAEGKTGDGDADLRAGDIAVEIANRVFNRLRARDAGGLHFVDPRFTDADEREFGLSLIHI